ncbi:hypothetical protein SNE40_018177 [Patella caerulea]|uniref:Endonuclease/exonuclease/phosphatase domain-containing protein n=1 Tax=Patella caerulea TaxID=87958 RepID=A0AAN8JC21_PATCE
MASPLIVRTSSKVNTRQTTLNYDSPGPKVGDRDLGKTLLNITQSLSSITKQLGSYKTELSEIKSQLQDFSSLSADLVSVKKENSELHKRIGKLEDESKRENLILLGLEEKETELWEELKEKIRSYFVDTLNMRDAADDKQIPIERVQRLGRKQGNRARPVLIKFGRFKHRQLVFEAFRILRRERTNPETPPPLIIKEDFTERVRECRKKLGSVFIKIKNKAGEDKVSLRHDKLILNCRAFMYDPNSDQITACDGQSVPDNISQENRKCGQSSSTRNLSCICWNIHDLKSHVNSSLISFLSDYDIICLVETWCVSEDEFTDLLTDHFAFSLVRKYGGLGIIVFIRKQYFDLFERININCQYGTFVRVKDHILNNNIMLFCFLYLPPERSVSSDISDIDAITSLELVYIGMAF